MLEKMLTAGSLPEPTALRNRGSRRRKLWEIPHKFHCPVVGVCFSCDELRVLMNKVMDIPRKTTDFVLHTTAVGTCSERTRLAELLHKTLERRFALAIRQFSACKNEADLHAAWVAARTDAHRIPGALWATWSHPACNSDLEQEVYADIHMIQHQLGASTRTDLKAMQTLKQKNGEQKLALDGLSAEIEALRREKAQAEAGYRQQLADLQAVLAHRENQATELRDELSALRQTIPDLARHRSLTAQNQEAHRENALLRKRLAEQDKELARLREFARYAEETLSSLAQEDAAQAELPARDLGGKCVLCVGGRAGAVHSYREVVEQSGGRFLHHDGGLEESLHRIEGVVAAADVVICQAGCISHNAYWRVKDLCKRSGKPCMFVRNGSVSSFDRVIGNAGLNQLAPPDIKSCR